MYAVCKHDVILLFTLRPVSPRHSIAGQKAFEPPLRAVKVASALWPSAWREQSADE